jgi:hypothetical protein
MSYFIAVSNLDGSNNVIENDLYDKEKHRRLESLYVNTYFFDFSNGEKHQMTDMASKMFCAKYSVKILSSTKTTKSTFGAEYHGFHPGLGIVTRGKEHTRQVMRERGLVEAGDTMPNIKQTPKNPITHEIMKEFVQNGAEVSGQEAKALVEGTYADNNS